MTTKKNLVKTMFMNLQTDIYVNNDINPLTRAAGSDIPAYAAKYVDENNVIHPAVIHLTDPYGYDNDVHYPGDEPSANQTRAAQSGEYQYITADELAASNTRWGIRKRLLAYDKTIGNKLKHAAKGSSDSIYVEYEIKTDFELNYFLTLEGGMKWSGILPEPYVKKFETGVDGHFDFGAKIDSVLRENGSSKKKMVRSPSPSSQVTPTSTATSSWAVVDTPKARDGKASATSKRKRTSSKCSPRRSISTWNVALESSWELTSSSTSALVQTSL